MSQRGRPFEPGNKLGRGRPRGSRNKTSAAVKELLESHAVSLVGKLVVEAIQGNLQVMKLCIERVMPALQELPVQLGKLPTGNFAELAFAGQTVLSKAAAGKITLTEARRMTGLIDALRQNLETA